MMNALFGFSGRMRQVPYFLLMLATIPILMSAVFVTIVLTRPILSDPETPVFVARAVSYTLVYYIWMALSAKRLHDAGWSGWFACIFALCWLLVMGHLYLDIMGAGGSRGSTWYQWCFVGVIGMLKPSQGDNEYGPDPRWRHTGTLAEPGAAGERDAWPPYPADAAMATGQAAGASIGSSRATARKTFGRR